MKNSNRPPRQQGRIRHKIRFYPSIWADISRGLDRWQKEEALSDLIECAHIVPIASGGSNDLSNLVCSCRPCNRAKAARPLADFMATRAAI